MLFQASYLTAQTPSGTEKPTPPSGPLIQKRAPEFSQWKVTLKLAASELQPKPATSESAQASQLSESAPAGSTTTFTKTRDIIRIESAGEGNQSWNTWCQGSLQIVVWPDGKNVGIAARPSSEKSPSSMYTDFSTSDFQGFGWISTANYIGLKEFMGKQCLFFKDRLKVEIDAGDDSGASPAQVIYQSMAAYIDAETRLPVCLQDPNGISTYQFGTPPTAMQSLPQVVQKFLADRKKAAQSVARRPGRPF